MIQKLVSRIKELQSPIVVGLDPTIKLMPKELLQEGISRHGESLEAVAHAILTFNKEILDAVSDLIPAVKPQLAMYEQFGIPGLRAYEETLNYAQKKGLIVIADAKRGDIGSTSTAYATAHMGTLKIGETELTPFGADMLTVNPYLGSDGVQPFIEVCNEFDRGIFVLVKTSNPSSGELQDLLVDGRPIYEHMADLVNGWAEQSMDGDYSNVGAVVGATYPQMSVRLRELMPHVFFLVPGYGAQGATARDLRPCFDANGEGAIVNSSRGIIAAYTLEKYAHFGSEGFAKAAREAVLDMRKDILSVL